MKRNPFMKYLLSLVGMFLVFCFIACERETIEYPPEEQEPITNDFTLLKACIGKSQSASVALLTDHGFLAGENNKFLKTEDGVTKEVHIHSIGNVEMDVHNNDFDTLKQVFVQWLNEIRNSVAYTKLVRSYFELSTGWENNGLLIFNTPEELINALSTVSPAEGMYATFTGNDIYANEYSLTLYPGLSGVYMQIINSRAGLPDDNPESDLDIADLQKHILICKVDYLTFRYKGYYALNVTDKLNTGNEIPFLADYHAPSDFGSIRLYYRNTNNLLMDGTIVWMGCGALNFPASFRAGEQLDKGLSYPGQNHISYIDNSGTYVNVTDEKDLKHVWQSVSRQKEFQHFYKHSSKKVAVYLYAPSVGIGNPADAYYLVFTEQ